MKNRYMKNRFERRYSDAINVQYAGNPCGIARSLWELCCAIQNETHSTAAVARNPAVKSYVVRLAELCGFTPPADMYNAIMNKCRDMHRRSAWHVSFEIRDADSGEIVEDGFEAESVCFRDAFEAVRQTRTSAVDCVQSVEPNECPARNPRWVQINNGREFITGQFESRAIHFPDHITPSSKRRICRLLGYRGTCETGK